MSDLVCKRCGTANFVNSNTMTESHVECGGVLPNTRAVPPRAPPRSTLSVLSVSSRMSTYHSRIVCGAIERYIVPHLPALGLSLTSKGRDAKGYDLAETRDVAATCFAAVFASLPRARNSPRVYAAISFLVAFASCDPMLAAERFMETCATVRVPRTSVRAEWPRFAMEWKRSGQREVVGWSDYAVSWLRELDVQTLRPFPVAGFSATEVGGTF